MSKLTKAQVIIIGVVLILAVLAGSAFFLIKPRYLTMQEEIKKAEERQQIAAELPQAQRDLEAARLENLQAKLDYRRYEDAKMPEISLGDRTMAMIATWHEYTEVLGPMIGRYPRAYGVDVLKGVGIQAPPASPNSLQEGWITLTLGEMQVRGDLTSLMRHVKGWNNFSRVVQVSPIRIEGTSPNLTGTYTMTLFYYPRGKMGPAVPIAGNQDVSNQGGGGGGGGLQGGPTAPAAPMPGPAAAPSPGGPAPEGAPPPPMP